MKIHRPITLTLYEKHMPSKNLEAPHIKFMHQFFEELIEKYFEDPRESEFIHIYDNIITNTRLKIRLNTHTMGYGIYFEPDSGCYINNNHILKYDDCNNRAASGIQLRVPCVFYIQCVSVHNRISTHKIEGMDGALNIKAEITKYIYKKTQEFIQRVQNA